MDKQSKETIALTLVIVVMSWLMGSVLGSAIVADNDSCDKNYHIENVLFVKMFCETKE